MLVGIVGAAGAGKDTVGGILCEEVNNMHKLSFADALKNEVLYSDFTVEELGDASILNVINDVGWDEAKRRYPSVRKELQKVGVSRRETKGSDYWIKKADSQRVAIGNGKDNQHYTFCDVRFLNEVEYIMSMFGLIVSVEREDNPFAIDKSHVSEQMVVRTPLRVLNNGDKEELRAQVIKTFNIKNNIITQRAYKSYVVNDTLRCTKCNFWLPLDDFSVSNKTWNGRSTWCKKCHAKFIKNKPYRTTEARYEESRSDSSVAWDLKNKFGLSISDYKDLMIKQNHVCAICNMPEKKIRKNGRPQSLAVDHDHETGEVRGLLCSSCNTAIGSLGDSYENVKRAANYLKPWKKEENV